MSFENLYGQPGSDVVKDRPKTFQERQTALRPPLKSLSNKQRGFVDCIECGKKRIIYSEKALKKEGKKLLAV